MSLLSKIFIVVVTVLSLVFLGVQATLYYHSNDWREAYERLEQRMKISVQEKDEEIAKMRGQYGDLEKTKAAVDATLEQIRTVAKATDSALADKGAELNRLQQQYANLESSLKVLGASIDEKDKAIREYTARISTLEENLKTAQGDKELAEAQVARVTSIKVALEKDMSELRKDYTTTKQKLLDSQLVLEDLERQGVPVSTLVINHKPLPPIRGKVSGVQSDLVLLTVGKDDRVEKGFPFTVYRENEFIAKVVVERVMADSAGCRVLFTAAGKAIKQGDNVATVLD